MSTYAIGDIQGCYTELLDLLEKINFDESRDRLWCTGDLVNRGPQSLETIRFVKNLGKNVVVTLGNHDLHLIAVANQKAKKHGKDTIDEIINSVEWPQLETWLRTLPLIHQDKELDYTLIHAGLLPQWNLEQAKELAAETEQALRADNYLDFFTHMYGDTPACWSDDLSGWNRLRVIINSFTRMRYCDEKGCMALKEKGPPGSQTKPFQPWFTIPARKTKNEKIIFGHWSTVYLGNINDFPPYNVYPLDTGCLWGGSLTALKLEDGTLYSVPSRQPKINK